MLPALLWTLGLFVVPFASMVAMSLWRRSDTTLVRTWDLQNYAAFFAKPYFVEGLLNSLEITVVVTVISVLLAYPLAWFIAERVPERWQRTALLLAIVPFWTSCVVRSYAWTLVLAGNGIVNQALVGSGLVDQPLAIASTRTATVIGFVHFFVMLLTLTIYANLRQLSPNYSRAAADLGASRVQTFIHVIGPLTVPGVAVGAFVTFVLCICSRTRPATAPWPTCTSATRCSRGCRPSPTGPPPMRCGARPPPASWRTAMSSTSATGVSRSCTPRGTRRVGSRCGRRPPASCSPGMSSMMDLWSRTTTTPTHTTTTRV